jgi:hypothetical protein
MVVTHDNLIGSRQHVLDPKSVRRCGIRGGERVIMHRVLGKFVEPRSQITLSTTCCNCLVLPRSTVHLG